MEKSPRKSEGTKAHESARSLVEAQRQEAFDTVLAELDRRFPGDLKRTFTSHEREYTLTGPEDCMVAFAQQHREAVESLYQDIVAQNNYRAEQATVKLLKLFEAYERMVALYAELRSYYPNAASAVEEKLPPLHAVVTHAEKTWQQIGRE